MKRYQSLRSSDHFNQRQDKVLQFFDFDWFLVAFAVIGHSHSGHVING